MHVSMRVLSLLVSGPGSVRAGFLLLCLFTSWMFGSLSCQNGKTPLMVAKAAGKTAVVKLLEAAEVRTVH